MRSEHLRDLIAALEFLDPEVPRIDRWGDTIALTLQRGGRLLAAGNGGSAAHAQHLTAEFVGRYLRERRAYSAIALHADTSAMTAIVNDYGADEAFARGVEAHGRRGDIFVAISTSGRSPNLVRAAATATRLGLTVFALTGAAPNPLASASSDAISIPGATPTVQEVHQVVVHLVCEAADRRLCAPALSSLIGANA
jgi:phosphoheptose isomerase